MPPRRRRSTRSTRAKIVDLPASDDEDEMEVEDEYAEPDEVVVDDVEEDEGSDNKEDELEEDEQEVQSIRNVLGLNGT